MIVSTLGQPSLILFKTYLPLSSGKPYKITFSKKGPSDPAAMSRLRLLGFPFQISCITSSYSRFFKGHSSFGQGGGQSIESPIIEYQSEYSIDILIIGNFMTRMSPNTPTVKLYTPIYSESTQKSYTIDLGLYLQFLGYICLILCPDVF